MLPGVISVIVGASVAVPSNKMPIGVAASLYRQIGKAIVLVPDSCAVSSNGADCASELVSFLWVSLDEVLGRCLPDADGYRLLLRENSPIGLVGSPSHTLRAEGRVSQQSFETFVCELFIGWWERVGVCVLVVNVCRFVDLF